MPIRMLYQLTALSMRAGVGTGYSQQTQPIEPKRARSSTEPLIARNVTSPERLTVQAPTADVNVSGQVINEKVNGLPGGSSW